MAGGNGGEFRYRRDVGRLVGFCGAGAALQTHLAAICKYGIADARAAGRRIGAPCRRTAHFHAGAHRSPDAAGHCSERSEEHTSELQSLMRISYAVFCLKKKKYNKMNKKSVT